MEAPENSSRAGGWALGAVLLLALGLRLAFLLSWWGSPFQTCPILDAWTFRELGAQVAAEGPAGLGLIWRPPLYPLLIGLLGGVGGGELALLLLQVLLGTLSVYLVHRLGRQLVGAGPALAGAFLLAIHWTSIFFTSQMLIATLFTFLLLVTLVALVELPEEGAGRAVGAGILAGFTCLARPTLLPCVGAWGLVLAGKGRGRQALGLACGALVTLAPVGIHNYRVSGLFLPLSAIGGYNLFIGNGPGVDGKTVWSAQQALADLDLPAHLDPLANQHAYLSATWQEISARPLRWLGLMGRKLYFLGNSYETSSNVDIYYSVSRVGPWLGWLALVPTGVLVSLALFGLALTRHPARAWPVLVFLPLFSLTLIGFFVNARFRIPLVPLICLYGAAGAGELWQRRAALASVRGLGTALLLGGLLWGTNTRHFRLGYLVDDLEVDLRHAGAFLAAGELDAAESMVDYVLGYRPLNRQALRWRYRIRVHRELTGE